MQTSLKLPSLSLSLSLSASHLLLLLLPLLVSSSSHEDLMYQPGLHKSVEQHFHKLSPQMTSNVAVHGLLLWFSMGFLMPVGILIIRTSARQQHGTTKSRVFFYLHVVLQISSVLLATAGAVMSLKNFENSFNNSHQRLGLALYGAIWVQTLLGVFRPRRGKKERSVWFLAHWMLGTLISLFGIINIYTGLNAYHKKTQKSSGLWTIIFTAELSFIAVYYLFQDKKDYIQKQGVILDNLDQPITINQDEEIAQNQRDLILTHQPCGKHNALKNLFD